MADRFMPGDLVEIRYPKDPARAANLRPRRKGPLIGAIIGRMTESDVPPEVNWIGFERRASRRIAEEYGEENPYYDEDAFLAEELVLHMRKRRMDSA